MFSISDKVVYVGGPKRPRLVKASTLGVPKLKKGRVYVVRDVWASSQSLEGFLIQLVGMPEVAQPYTGRRMGFSPSRFRKLTDIQAENALRIAEPALANK